MLLKIEINHFLGQGLKLIRFSRKSIGQLIKWVHRRAKKVYLDEGESVLDVFVERLGADDLQLQQNRKN